MIPITPRGALAGIALAVAFASGVGVTKLWADARIATLEKEAAQRIASGYQAAERVNRESVQSYAENLARLRSVPPRIVRVCPNVPGASGAVDSPTQPGADPGAGDDLGPTLRSCLDELYRYKALTDAIKANRDSLK